MAAGSKLPAPQRYLLAAGIFAAALALRFLVLPVDAGLAFLIFYPGTALAALFCGRGPGLLYIVAAAGTGAYIFNPPFWAWGDSDLLPAATFVASAATILLVIVSYQRRAARQAQELTDEVAARRQLAGQLQQSLDRLGELETEFRQTFEQAGVGIAHVAPDGRWLRANRRLGEIVGRDHAALLALTVCDLLHPDDRPAGRVLQQRLLAGDSDAGGCELRCLRPDGRVAWIKLMLSLAHAADGGLHHFIAVVEDISAIKDSQRELEYIARHDELTTLPNRNTFQDLLRRGVARARREERTLAVLFIDLDNFKTINDTLGHDVGDLLLQAVAGRLLACMRDADTVARLGGDEFAALLDNSDSPAVSAVCQRIIAALSEAFRLAGTDLFVTASIGISLFPGDGDDGGTLLKNADVAMYRAKEQGKNQFQYFAIDLNFAMQRRLALETGLRRALQQNLFSLHYQPKMRIADSALIGAEALIRWSDPEIGSIPPGDFIPVAEKTGLIGAISLFVASRAIDDIVAWRAAGLVVPPIALNVSPSQLRDKRFADWLHGRLAEAGLPASSLVVELTEGALMEPGEGGLQVLDTLARRGTHISIDDFGTGYSSLSYLKRMPIAELKIDRSFVDGIADDPDDRAIASAILNLAHTLGLSAVAEGVESEEQLAVLRLLGCDAAQGYLFHRPMPEEAFRALLQANADAPPAAGAAPACPLFLLPAAD